MNKKILITDDDEGVQDIFKLIFERAGYDVEIYGEAKSILENNYVYPDLFLLDRQLSGQDGVQVCQFLKSQSLTKDTCNYCFCNSWNRQTGPGRRRR